MATYGIRIKRNGKIVTDANEAQSVLINVHGGGNVGEYMDEVQRWQATLPRRVENAIDRFGYQRVIAKTVGRDAIEWA
jgi:transcriptional regulator with AAA-type ATPase domain